MFLWFLGTAAMTVWLVFRDDRFDYRVLFLGVIAVDLIDGPLGGARAMHSVLTSVAILMAVMVVTRRGTVRRRRWLALPIGTFLHLVFDGAFGDARVFWWPLREVASLASSEPISIGRWWSVFDGVGLPSIERGALNFVFEAVGAALLFHLWRTHDLGRAENRARFIRDGRLVQVRSGSASVARPGEPGGPGTC